MNEPDIDIETLRQSRAERFTRWLSQFPSEVMRRSWQTAEAVVLECTSVREFRDWSDSIDVAEVPILTGYVVRFSYEVNGNTYTGVLVSPIAVEAKDRFPIRYNPARPQENNSLSSKGDFVTSIATFATSLLALVALAALAIHFLHRY